MAWGHTNKRPAAGGTLRRLVMAILVSLTAAVASGATALNIVTTTEDLAALTREVGGERVNVEAIARGYQDPHFVESKPSYILRLQRTDLLVAVGRDLEVGWLPALVQQSRNAKIQPGARAYLDASLTARILQIPTGQVTRAMGDVHPLGNPHYWLDPGNGRRIAHAIATKLAELMPSHADYFNQRYLEFDRRLSDAEKRWDALMAPYRGLKIVTYHGTWPNFAERFGLTVIGYVEPKPGIPPSAAHTRDVIQMMQQENVKILLVEPYFDLKTPNAIARATGARVLVMAPSVGGVKEATDYIKLFDHNLNLLIDGIKQAG